MQIRHGFNLTMMVLLREHQIFGHLWNKKNFKSTLYFALDFANHKMMPAGKGEVCIVSFHNHRLRYKIQLVQAVSS